MQNYCAAQLVMVLNTIYLGEDKARFNFYLKKHHVLALGDNRATHQSVCLLYDNRVEGRSYKPIGSVGQILCLLAPYCRISCFEPFQGRHKTVGS